MPTPNLASLPSALVVIPLLLLLSLPLLPLAIVTTSVAATCLAIRALWIYAELAGNLVRQQLFYGRSDPAPVALALSEYSLKSSGYRHPLYTFPAPGSGATTPARRPSSSYGLAGAASPLSFGNAFGNNGNGGSGSGSGSGNGAGSGSFYSVQQGGSGSAWSQYRDYEGVGGWRDEDEDADADAQWTSMNRRLELPSGAKTPGGSVYGGSGGGAGSGRPAHRRSFTAGSARAGLDRGVSALSLRTLRRGESMVNSTASLGAGRPRSTYAGSTGSGGGGSGDYYFLMSPAEGAREHQRLSGHASPDEGGLVMKTSRSMVDMENVGRPKVGERRKSGSSGSVSSGNSQRTMTSTTGQGWMAP